MYIKRVRGLRVKSTCNSRNLGFIFSLQCYYLLLFLSLQRKIQEANHTIQDTGQQVHSQITCTKSLVNRMRS